MSDVTERLKRVRSLMLIKHPFFASLMMSMPMIETDMIPTAATDMEKLYINPKFVAELTNPTLLFVLAHEIMHCALAHGIRLGARNARRWNVATDYAINLILKNSGFDVWEHALLDSKYADMSADQIYNLLAAEEPPPQPQSSAGGKSGDGDGQSGDGSGPPQPPGVGEPGNEHHSPMLGDLIKPECDGDAVAEDAMRKKIQQKVAQAAVVARMTGNLSGDLERFVGEVLEPKVPWFEKLRHLMVEHQPDDEDWSRRNRRIADFYMPSDWSERMGEIVMIGDTSGSIGHDELVQYSSEAASIAEDCRPIRIRMLWADTVVAGEQVFEENEPFDPKPKGGGGTDMRVPLKKAEEYDPSLVVLFTDCYTPWPDSVPYPLIVCSTTAQEAPVGETVHI